VSGPVQTFAGRPVRALRRGADGEVLFWEEEDGRMHGGPNGPIASTTPSFREWMMLTAAERIEVQREAAGPPRDAEQP